MATLVSKRPWGQFAQYTLNEQSTVKIITVEPQQRLSVQFHHNRDEMWVALDGGLIATINEEQRVMVPGQEIFIERGAVHTVENRGYETARFLEISFGFFDEADIVRISDKYGRA
jgi:mannose-6-phosphate isomerase